MSLHVTSDEYNKIVKDLDYKGCRNCVNQIEPFRSCQWTERGGDHQIHLICPKWIKKGKR